MGPQSVIPADSETPRDKIKDNFNLRSQTPGLQVPRTGMTNLPVSKLLATSQKKIAKRAQTITSMRLVRKKKGE